MEAKKILFLGGSITCGAGASCYENAWASKVFASVGEVLCGKGVQMLNAGISGTGSHVAVFRIGSQVLPYKPDVAFVEFAVNDISMSKKDPELVISCMEHIVRALKEANPAVAITFIYTTAKGRYAGEVHHKVAAHYGIPEIDLHKAAVSLVERGEESWEGLLCDGVHPTDHGHALYARLVTEAILADPERYQKPTADADAFSPFSFQAPRIRSAEEGEMDGFSYEPIRDRAHLKRMQETVIHSAALSDKVGATLTFRFSGEHFGIYHRIGNFGGRFSVTLDGKEAGVVDTYNRYGDGTDPLGEMLSFYARRSLGKGEHKVTLTVLEPNPASGGSLVTVAGFFVDEGK